MEDFVPNQVLAMKMLQKMGCRVDVVVNGEEALDILHDAQPYDLIFMDCQMPEMDGFEATAAIRKQPWGRDMIIIAMTANALKGDRDACLNAGMNDYISKPISVAALEEMLDHYLNRKDAAAERPIGHNAAKHP